MRRQQDQPTGAEIDPDRRRLLTILGAAGIVGFAGCGGDGDGTDTGGNGNGNGNGGMTDTGTGTDTGGNGNGNGNGSMTDTATPTETEVVTTTEPGCNLGPDPEQIFTFGDDLTVSPLTEEITSAFRNPYLGSTLESGSVEVTTGDGENAPPDGWSLEPNGATEFDVLETGGSKQITWSVEAPEMEAEFPLTITTTYSCGEETYEVETNPTMEIGPPEPAPAFVNSDIDPDKGNAVSVIRQSGHFTPLQLLPGGGAQMVYFPQGVDTFNSVQFDWAGNYADDEWHHCVASYDSAEGMKGYIDGALVGENSASGELQAAGSNIPFGIGAVVGNPVTEMYEGDLDELGVYDTALTESQAQSLANGEAAAEDSLVSKWTFDEVVFSRVEDQVGDNTMYLANSPEQVSGQVGQAIAFDGQETFGGAPSSDSLNLTDQKSVSFWFKTTQSLE
jgi:hypothetical protein